MRVLNLTENSPVYTSNAYLLTGNWNTMSDVNTLIDAGHDPHIIQKLNEASTGVGKKKLEQILLTHGHYDHAGMVKKLKEEFEPQVLAFSPALEGVDRVLQNGETIRAGEGLLEVIHMPGHSTDSVCFYDKENGILFAGDSPLIITTPTTGYDEEFIKAFERLCSLKIQIIYFGHGKPFQEHVGEVLLSSYRMICPRKM